jgi:hypothetical protein
MLPTMLLVFMSLTASLALTRLVDYQEDDGKDESVNMPHTGAYLTYAEKRSVPYPTQDRYRI